jgi:hypothetical protein
VPIYVYGVSGGFLAPFVHPEQVWDFRLQRVKSINASGHKYGLAPLGVGWAVRGGLPALIDSTARAAQPATWKRKEGIARAALGGSSRSAIVGQLRSSDRDNMFDR